MDHANPALLSVTDATILAVSLSILYILGYYIAIRALNPRLSAQHDLTTNTEHLLIKARLFTILLTCGIATGLVYWPVYQRSDWFPNGVQFMNQLGIRWNGLGHALVLPSLLIILLFGGPLVQMYLSNELFFQDRVVMDLFIHRLFSVYGQRSYILGPICEEYVFRSCIILPFYHSGVSFNNIVLYTPLFFGLAHLHNIYDIFRRYGKTMDAFKKGIVSSLFQFSYTTIFGWICSFVYLRTGHLASVICMHIFCNIMGVPAVNEIHLSRRPFVVWASYLVGVLLFVISAKPLTNPKLYSNTIFVDT